MNINDPCYTLAITADNSNNVAIEKSTTHISIHNPSSAIAYVKTGKTGVTATTSDTFIPAGATITFEKDTTHTHLAGICSSNVTLNIQCGRGL